MEELTFSNVLMVLLITGFYLYLAWNGSSREERPFVLPTVGLLGAILAGCYFYDGIQAVIVAFGLLVCLAIAAALLSAVFALLSRL